MIRTTPEDLRLEHWLRAQDRKRRVTPPDAHYSGPHDFVLREGRPMRPGRLPTAVAAGPFRYCFALAIQLAVHGGYPYVEGYAMNAYSMLPVHHAWNLGADGTVIDTSWGDESKVPPGAPVAVPMAGRAYRGVCFSARRADEATWDGDACVLDDHRRGHPILLDPWTPDDSPGPAEDLRALQRTIADRYVAEVPGYQPEQVTANIINKLLRGGA